MNPKSHEGRHGSPFVDRAESAGVVDDVHVLDATPVRAADVAGTVNLSPLTPDRWYRTLVTASIVTAILALGAIALMAVVGGAL